MTSVAQPESRTALAILPMQVRYSRERMWFVNLGGCADTNGTCKLRKLHQLPDAASVAEKRASRYSRHIVNFMNFPSKNGRRRSSCRALARALTAAATNRRR